MSALLETIETGEITGDVWSKSILVPSVTDEMFAMEFPARSFKFEIVNETNPSGSDAVIVYDADQLRSPPDIVAVLPSIVPDGDNNASFEIKVTVTMSPGLALDGSALFDIIDTGVTRGSVLSNVTEVPFVVDDLSEIVLPARSDIPEILEGIGPSASEPVII